jgi:MarR family 2-MHQ and catechol resistance regulon transcriptional repressor
MEELTALEAGDDAAEFEDSLRSTALRYKSKFPWADPESIESVLAVGRTSRLIGAALARYLDSLGLGIGQSRYTVLRTLYFAKDHRMRQNEIGREMNVSRTNITNLIDGLEKDTLVTRVGDLKDRRATFAQLTPSGLELCESLLPAMTRFMTFIGSRLTSEQKTTFLGLISEISRQAESLEAGVSAP